MNDLTPNTEPIVLRNAGRKSTKLSDKRMRMVLDYIEENLGGHLTISGMAKAAALSPFHFTRSFKASTGTTPARYVWKRRIELARSMLKDRQFTLVEVALACGYSSQSHFTTAFKEATGLTPAVYRASLN